VRLVCERTSLFWLTIGPSLAAPLHVPVGWCVEHPLALPFACLSLASCLPLACPSLTYVFIRHYIMCVSQRALFLLLYFLFGYWELLWNMVIMLVTAVPCVQ
jgi:hypothetical protein